MINKKEILKILVAMVIGISIKGGCLLVLHQPLYPSELQENIE
ncbi:hypothetical protein [Blautia faecicola]|nr:hypothetical protein [Blautia faecicola]